MVIKKLFLGMLVMVLAFGFTLAACDDTKEDGRPPEEKTAAERWVKWVASDTKVKLDISVSKDEICTITVSGTPSDIRWKASPRYHYTVKKDLNYTYKFEAWTKEGDRNIRVQYYEDNDDLVYKNRTISITSERKTYTIVGVDLPKGGENKIAFQCGDKLGTFYVKIISITEGGEFDSVKILSVTPDTGLIDGVETDFTVKVEYSLATEEKCKLSIWFNSDSQNSYSHYGTIEISKGKGNYTFENITVIPKNWRSEGDEFGVSVTLLPLEGIFGLAWEEKVLSFE